LKLVVHVDGGARGNPGPAAIGVVVTTPEGEVVRAMGTTIGEATNNVAEYRALLHGIEVARELGASELEIYGDSELVVKQVRGEYKVKDAGLKPLHAEARSALAEVGSWSFDHVRRENNADADLLVNQALDAAG
jgi:ribonuclease HI